MDRQYGQRVVHILSVSLRRAASHLGTAGPLPRRGTSRRKRIAVDLGAARFTSGFDLFWRPHIRLGDVNPFFRASYLAFVPFE
jgi:hypothetical protein